MLINKVLENINNNKLIEKGESIVMGVSGGPDSICMLHIINHIKLDLSLKISVVHINHMIRGTEADQDQEYVEKFCESLGVECYSFKLPVRQIAEEKKISEEECGRELRYDKFYEVAQIIKSKKVIVAQNMNDQAETILMRAIRGSGLDGICGIFPINTDKTRGEISIVRPLLNIKREEIEQYCKENNLKPRIDKTNYEKEYSRNKIRLDIIPYIAENFNKNIINTLYRMGELLKEDNNYIDIKSYEMYNQCIDKKYKDKIILNSNKFSELHTSIKRRVLRLAIEELLGGELKGIESKHLEYIQNHIEGKTGKFINISNDIVIYNNYGFFEICKKHMLEIPKDFCYNIILSREMYLKEIDSNVMCELIQNQGEICLKEDRNTIYLDYEKIQKLNLQIRNRREGDKIPLENGKNKKLKDFFIDIKIDKRKRNSIPLLTLENDVIWVIGCRKTNIFKADKNTNKILKICIRKFQKIH